MPTFENMKSIQYIVYLAMVFFILSCSTKVEKSDVPESITTSFEEAFPDAENVEWSTKGDDIEATFMKGDEEVLLRFKTDGTYEVVDREAEDAEDIETILHTSPIP